MYNTRARRRLLVASAHKASVSAPRILLVDDQRDITRMLRTALETLGHGYVIVDVPSAEEAQLEMRRGHVDLLITDVRLPGISGLELIRRLRKASSDAGMIVISAYADDKMQADIVKLGAIFFAKPLSLEQFLESVQRALGSRAVAPAPESGPAVDEQDGVAVRLARLRRDLGALAILLADADGRIAVRAGDAAGLDLDSVLTPIMAAVSAAVKVGQALGGPGPNSLHFFDGEAYDAYAAAVGPDFSLVMLFEGERGAAQMGPVLRYGRQCADELLALMRKLGLAAPPVAPGTPLGTAPLALSEALAAQAAQLPATAPLRIGPRTGPLGRPGTGPLGRPGTGPLGLPEPPPAPVPEMTEAELRALDEAARKVKAQDAASFWAAAADGEAGMGDVRAGTLSFEQAAQLGLIKSES